MASNAVVAAFAAVRVRDSVRWRELTVGSGGSRTQAPGRSAPGPPRLRRTTAVFRGSLVANETLARELFGSWPAVGQRVVSSFGEPWEVVGVVGTSCTQARCSRRSPSPKRSSHWLRSAARGVRQALIGLRRRPDHRRLTGGGSVPPRSRGGDGPSGEARLGDDDGGAGCRPRSRSLASRRYSVGSFAGLALLLAALGIFGLLSYTVAHRRGEIGMRMALGARRGDILALVARQGAERVAVGAATGMAGAAASSRVLESLRHGVATDDLLTFVAAPLLLLAVAWSPAGSPRGGQRGSIRLKHGESSDEGHSTADLGQLSGRQRCKCVQNAADKRPQMNHAVRRRANDHDAKSKGTEILLVLKTSIHAQQGIEGPLGTAEQLTVRRSRPARGLHRADLVPRQLGGESTRQILVKQNAHGPGRNREPERAR